MRLATTYTATRCNFLAGSHARRRVFASCICARSRSNKHMSVQQEFDIREVTGMESPGGSYREPSARINPLIVGLHILCPHGNGRYT